MITTYSGQDQSHSSLSVLVCHGAMQIKFDQFHPLVQHYQKYFKNVFSVELPGHGSQRQFDNVSLLPVSEMIEILYNEITEACPTEKLFVTAYSVGGLLFIKLWERLCMRNKDLRGIFIGTGITIRPETINLVSKFFSEETYIKLGWEGIMIRQHGPKWRETVRMINNWYQPGSGILPTTNELNFLIEQDKKNRIFFILGKEDQPFKRNDIQSLYAFSLFEIESDHFSYFIIKRAWPNVKELINKILNNWFKIELRE